MKIQETQGFRQATQTFAYIEVYEKPVPWIKKPSHDAVKLQAGEENKIIH